MAYLLYGIMNESTGTECHGVLTCMKDKPVLFVAAHGLCAALSELDVEVGAPPVADLLAYARVVAALHQHQTVIPMRYGSYLNGIPAVQDLLRVKQRQYETLLAELEGRVEMGVRISLPENGSGERVPDVPVEATCDGRSYLALRKAHYRTQEAVTQDRQACSDRYIQAFAAISAKQRAETAAPNGILTLSLYFLVAGENVCRFREIFAELTAGGTDTATLTGPWPPYNFVTADSGTIGESLSSHLQSRLSS